MKPAPTLPAAFLADVGQTLPGPLQAIQLACGQALQDMPLPTRKTENWKYSSRYLSFDEALAPALDSGTAANESAIPAPPASGYRIVIHNGRIERSLSELPDSPGFRVVPFSDLNDEDAEKVGQRLDQSLNQATTQVARLNTARLQDGILIEVASNTEVDRPVYVQALADTDAGQPGSVYPRVMVEMGAFSKLTLVEQYDATGGPCLVNAVTEANVGDSADLTYIRLTLEPEAVRHIGATGVRLAANSRFESHCIGFGGALRRHDLQIRFEAPGAECVLNGVAVTQNSQHYDNHTVLEHVAGHCNSEETYRCMAAGKSHNIFNGRIHIHRDAQKTNAQMSNKNLLLSAEAEIDTKPELEIYADDVKCAHGATVGRLDPEALFYLLARGIDRSEANTLLSMGFINEIVARIPLENIREQVDQRLAGFIQNNLIED